MSQRVASQYTQQHVYEEHVLQCVAVVLQCVADVLQCVAVCYSVLQCVAV